MISCHCHCDQGSNIRLLDTTNTVKGLLETAVQLQYQGLAITDHESLSAHLEAITVAREMKKEGKMPSDFKLILGNEIYLCDSLEEVRDNYKGGVTKFPHFLLLSKDAIGHEQLRILSSRAWDDSFYTGIMERVPTVKKNVEDVVMDNKGHLIASTACLGSESSILLLARKEAEENNDSDKVIELNRKLDSFFKWCISVFGKENFFIELQPALSEEQIYVNKELIPIADHYGLKRIVTTDAHFLRPPDREIHKAFLNSKEGDREVDAFYEACFLASTEEIYERMDYLDKEIVADAIQNTVLIGEMIEDYTIEHEPIIPKMGLPPFELKHLFKPAYDKYEYIHKVATSENEQDRYLMKLVEDGFLDKLWSKEMSSEYFHEILGRINIELGELWEIGQSIQQSMPSYYITIREIINIIWDDECGNSLVGASRGSSVGFLINYLIDITQINPMTYDLPHWRHIHKSRPDFPDIDIDTEGMKRQQILKALRNRFGSDRVLQIATFGTEGSKSAIKTACRGLMIDNDIAQFITNMIPFERGENWSLSDCFYGNEEKDRKPIREFIREIEQYPKLKETALSIEGLVNKRSSHAAGVVLFNEPYTKTNAMMRTPKGAYITQFNMNDCERMGSIKFDLLTIEALDKIRATLDQLIANQTIDWKGSIKETYNQFIHPDMLDYSSPEIWDMVGNGEIMDLFQFSTEVGHDAAIKVKPKNLLEASVANSLMRLMSDGEEQPVDTYVRYKNDISLWYEEMESYGLTKDEVAVMEKYLKELHGMADTQEVVMQMSMDAEISNFSIKESNYLRKSIAKKKAKVLQEVEELFFKKGREIGTSENLLNYVWNVQFKRQFGYSFSLLHTLAYSIIALQEINLNHRYNPLYWNTACLSVNAGSIDDESEDSSKKSTNYGKVASAIGNIRKRGVKVSLPHINDAEFGFKADIKNDAIIYGLKGILGVGDDVVHALIANRPYASFEDFFERMFATGIIKKKQVIQLIKAGAFDSFSERESIMKSFVERTADQKEKLNMQNFNMLMELDIIPKEYALQVRLYRFKKYISKCVHITMNKPKNRLFYINHVALPFFEEHFSEDLIEDLVDGVIIISEKRFNKAYDSMMQGVKEWMATPGALDKLNQRLVEIEWDKYAYGSISQWEMDSLSFYYHDHELSDIDNKMYGIKSFSTLSEEPIKGRGYMWRGRQMYEYETVRIAGTVLDKNKNKHTITLLTPDDVVTVKFYAGAFSYYDKQISVSKGDKKEVLEKSWFTRGNKLLLTGYRRGNQFIPKRYNNSIYQHTVARIDGVNEQGVLSLITERKSIQQD